MTLAQMIEREVAAACQEVRDQFSEGPGVRKIRSLLLARVRSHGRKIVDPTPRQRNLLKWIAGYKGPVPPYEAMSIRWDTLGGLMSRGLVRTTPQGFLIVTRKGRML